MNPVEVAKHKGDHDSTGPQKRGRKRKTDLEAAAATATMGNLANDPGPWLQRSILVHCEDSYSVNCASMSWLLACAEARYLWLPDPWHMVHNVGLNCVKEANCFASVILTSTAMDVSWGPWNSEKWFRTLGQGVSEWLSHTGSDDPIVQVLLPRIAEEQGWEETNAAAEDVAHAVMHARFMTAKGTKSMITRWWVWHERFASWIGEDLFDNATEPSRKSGEWTLRLVPLLYIGLQLQFVTPGSRQILKPLGQGVSNFADGDSIRSAKEQQARARESCKNNLHLATAPWLLFIPFSAQFLYLKSTLCGIKFGQLMDVIWFTFPLRFHSKLIQIHTYIIQNSIKIPPQGFHREPLEPFRPLRTPPPWSLEPY